MIENEGLADLLKAYRIHYGLTQEVVERLARLKKNKYSRIESGRQKPTSADIKAISKVYGLESYQISNPKYPKPAVKKLPVDTQKAILEIKNAGTQPRASQNKVDLGKEIDKLIMLGKMNDPITAKGLFLLLPEEIQDSIKKGASKVTDILTRSPRNKIIEIVDRPEGKTDAGNWYRKINDSENN